MDTIATDVVVIVDTARAIKMELMRDPSYAFKAAMFTWLLTGLIGFGVAVIMKVLYLIMKRTRIKDDIKHLAAK